MKISRTIGILALVAGLVLGGVGSAFAQGPPDGSPGGGPHSPGKRGLFGTVTSVATVTANVTYIISLETKQGTFDITADDTAKYMVPRETHGPKNLATFLGIVGDPPAIEGRRVAVLATNLVEGGYKEFTADAVRLMLIPSAPLHAHRVGVVDTFIAGEGGKIIIIDRHGASHEFGVSENTVYRPAEITAADIVSESYVTVVTKGDPKKAGPIAKAIVLHEKTED